MRLFQKPAKNLPALERILLTLWVGGLWVTGFVVAPTLFAVIPERSLAGSVAGSLFTAMSIIGLVCGAVLLLIGALQKTCGTNKVRVFLLTAMLVIIVIGEFVLLPMIADLRVSGEVAGAQFAWLHGAASALYVLNCLLGLVLVVQETRSTLSG